LTPRSGCNVRSICCALTAWLWLVSGQAAASVHVQLAAALDQLREGGVALIYSSAFAGRRPFADRWCASEAA